LLLLYAIVLLATGLGCSGPGHGYVSDESGSKQIEKKIEVEAYSFNARLRRDGKPTTFKLEVYVTDTLLGLSGRGYLGKGALKGWLRDDSLALYFPATGEYVSESLSDLISVSDCPIPIATLNAVSLFRTLPDSIALADGLEVLSNYKKPDRPEFVITAADCLWQFIITYDLHKNKWRVREFEFTDGATNRLTAERDRHKSRAFVKASRFDPTPPDGAHRIRP